MRVILVKLWVGMAVLVFLFFGTGESFSQPTYQLEKFPANAVKGFQWPYYLVTPSSMTGQRTLLVEGNNTGYPSDDPAVHDEAARNLAIWRASMATDLQAPLLVPIFPRVDEVYTHALTRDCLTTTREDIKRVDLQLIGMIEDARSRLGEQGYYIDEKIFIMGFSASGAFANRFTAIHPHRVKAAAMGSPGGWPLAPLSSWEGENLDYHIGVADLETLIIQPFDLTRFISVPLFFFLGDQDTNDPYTWDGDDNCDRCNQVKRLFGQSVVDRWPVAERIYNSVGSNCIFELYRSVGHQFTQQMIFDVVNFFQSRR